MAHGNELTRDRVKKESGDAVIAITRTTEGKESNVRGRGGSRGKRHDFSSCSCSMIVFDLKYTHEGFPVAGVGHRGGTRGRGRGSSARLPSNKDEERSRRRRVELRDGNN